MTTKKKVEPLVQALRALMRWSETDISEPGGGFDVLAEDIIPKADEALTYAKKKGWIE